MRTPIFNRRDAETQRKTTKSACASGRSLRLVMAFIILPIMLAAIPALAQTVDVTDDDVNAVAKRLYCPVCENQPLDTCMTEACQRWREEIRLQLADGSTPDQVVANFVAQFGERAVGTPLDPTLRAMAMVTPYVLAALALILGVFTFIRWRGRHPVSTSAASVPVGDDYLSQVERDLRGK
jgi:cytochrome c-type biogenesis protein CcmH